MTDAATAKLERALQEYVNEQAASDNGEPGLISGYFLALAYTRIDEENEQQYTRNYVASTNPYESTGVARLCLRDAEGDLGAGMRTEDD